LIRAESPVVVTLWNGTFVADRRTAAGSATPTLQAPARPDFPTAGDFVAYLLSSHLAYHLGQLVAWRAAAGLGRLSRPDALAA